MDCRCCKRRKTCTSLCAAMSGKLREVEVYQRELLIEPKKLTLLAEQISLTWSDLLPDFDWLWDDLFEAVNGLPSELVTPFFLHFREGLSVNEVSDRLRLSSSTVNRRLKKALELIRKKRTQKPKSRTDINLN